MPLRNDHLIRVGVLGQVGRFRAPEATVFERGRRVICRTRRGLEVGQVLREPSFEDRNVASEVFSPATADELSADGTVLRLVTPEDDLLLARLERHRQKAFDACVALLAQHGVNATLVEVEHLFDGSSLYFYFLGAVDARVDALTQQLAAEYETNVEFRRFAETLEHGCGPACGTEAGGGCGTSCGSCAIAAACSHN